jgi:hypothetical protein
MTSFETFNDTNLTRCKVKIDDYMIEFLFEYNKEIEFKVDNNRFFVRTKEAIIEIISHGTSHCCCTLKVLIMKTKRDRLIESQIFIYLLDEHLRLRDSWMNILHRSGQCIMILTAPGKMPGLISYMCNGFSGLLGHICNREEHDKHIERYCKDHNMSIYEWKC